MIKIEAAGEGTCPRYESMETTDPGNSPNPQMTPLSEGAAMDPKEVQAAIDAAVKKATEDVQAQIVKLSEDAATKDAERDKKVIDLSTKLSASDEKVALLERRGAKSQREAWLSEYDLSPAQKDIFRDLIAMGAGETVMLSEKDADGKDVERELTTEEKLQELAETMVDEGNGMNLSEADVRRPRRSTQGGGGRFERSDADDDAFLAEVDEEVKTQIKARGGVKEDHYQTAWSTVAGNRSANRREQRERAAGGR